MKSSTEFEYASHEIKSTHIVFGLKKELYNFGDILHFIILDTIVWRQDESSNHIILLIY